MISLDAITVSYGGFTLLDNVSLHIGDRDRIGLVGKNGAGKSTMLKLIMELQSPTSGKITRTAGQRIGYLPQIMEHHRGRTVLEEGVAQYSALSVGSYLGNAYGLYDVLGTRVEYVLDRYVNLTTMAAETVDPIGPYGGTYRIIRGQHVQNNHGLRYYALTVINVENIDNLSANTYQSYRFAIHLRPPQSFGGKWK